MIFEKAYLLNEDDGWQNISASHRRYFYEVLFLISDLSGDVGGGLAHFADQRVIFRRSNIFDYAQDADAVFKTARMVTDRRRNRTHSRDIFSLGNRIIITLDSLDLFSQFFGIGNCIAGKCI